MAVPRLTKRPQFLHAAKGLRAARPLLVVQANMPRAQVDSLQARVGFTATKKIGNAVHRNRAKRRLRALADALLPGFGMPGWDYVFIARLQTADAEWAQLLDEGKGALISLRSKAARQHKADTRLQ